MTDYDPNLAPKIQWHPLHPGRAGTRETLQAMAQLARNAASDTAFRNWVYAVGSNLEAFVGANYRYRDEVEEIVRTPEFMLNDLSRLGYMEGDCDDIATFYAAAFKAFGVPVRFMAIRYNADNPNFEHVFTQAYDGKQWRIYDGTVPPGTPMHAIETMTEDV